MWYKNQVQLDTRLFNILKVYIYVIHNLGHLRPLWRLRVSWGHSIALESLRTTSATRGHFNISGSLSASESLGAIPDFMGTWTLLSSSESIRVISAPRGTLQGSLGLIQSLEATRGHFRSSGSLGSTPVL
jgi:hypothetical protein